MFDRAPGFKVPPYLMLLNLRGESMPAVLTLRGAVSVQVHGAGARYWSVVRVIPNLVRALEFEIGENGYVGVETEIGSRNVWVNCAQQSLFQNLFFVCTAGY